MLKDETVRELLGDIISNPLQIFSLSIMSQSNHSLIEISLDNMDHPYGSVTIGDCELVSRKLVQTLEEKFGDENYTLQVSSAGAERELKIPNDLERFNSVPIRIFYHDDEGKVKDGVFKVVNLDLNKVELLPYKAKSSKKKPIENLILKIGDIKKGNLYLDF